MFTAIAVALLIVAALAAAVRSERSGGLISSRPYNNATTTLPARERTTSARTGVFAPGS